MNGRKDLDTIWSTKQLLFNAPEHYRRVNDWIFSYLPNASFDEAIVFLEDGKRYLASTVWDFATKSPKPARVELPEDEELP